MAEDANIAMRQQIYVTWKKQDADMGTDVYRPCYKEYQTGK